MLKEGQGTNHKATYQVMRWESMMIQGACRETHVHWSVHQEWTLFELNEAILYKLQTLPFSVCAHLQSACLQ